MKAIATYFAEIGFKVNQKDITEVNKTFSEMRKKFVDLNRSMRSGSGVEIKARISPHSFTQIERQIKSFERRMKPLDIRLKNLQMNKSGKGLNRSVAPSVDPKFEAAFSDSFKKMSDTLTQIRKLNEDSNKELKRLSTLTHSVNRRGGGIGGVPPRGGLFGWGGDSGRRGTDYGRRTSLGVTQSSHTNRSSGVGSTGLSRQSSSPFHNPLMMGGFAGSLTRYGLHALPMFGGVIGFNALSQAAIGAEKQKTSLDYAASISGTGLNGDQYREFLDKLGYDIGMSTDKLVDSFTYMLTNVAGSKAQTQLERGFSSLTKLSTILGHTQQQQDASLKAFTKMLTDPKATAAQLKGTPTDNIPHIMTLAAEALAGGDMNKLIEKLGNKEVVPDRDFPLIYEQIEKTIQPYMDEYYGSLRFSQNETQRLRDKWMAEFLDSGGSEAVRGIYDTLNYIIGDGTGGAKTAGQYIQAAGHTVNAVLLIPKEVKDYLEGLADPSNFLQHYLGDLNVGGLINSITEANKTYNEALLRVVEKLTNSKEGEGGVVLTDLGEKASVNFFRTLENIISSVDGKLLEDTQMRHWAEDLAKSGVEGWETKSFTEQAKIVDAIIATMQKVRRETGEIGYESFSNDGVVSQTLKRFLHDVSLGALFGEQESRDRIESGKNLLINNLTPEEFKAIFGDGGWGSILDSRSYGAEWIPANNLDGNPFMIDYLSVPQEYLETAKDTLDSLLESLMSNPRPVNNTISQELNITLNMESSDVLSPEEVVEQIKAASAEAINEALVATSSMYISGMA